MPQYPAIIDLSDLNGANGFKLDGEANSDSSGFSVASAGDINGDGFADLIVGSPDADPHGDKSGASYVVFGGASGFAAEVNLSTLDGNNGFKISGVAAQDYSGHSVASAGDLNSDGFADLIVGAQGADPHGSLSGASYVVFGHAGFTANLDLSALDGNNGFKLSGVAQFDRSGESVASAGDVNGDGFQDIVIGAHRANTDAYGYHGGAAYVVFGDASGFPANLDLSSLDGNNGFKISGKPQDYIGTSVSSAGDVNGDGFADVIIGVGPISYSGSQAYVVYGKASGIPANFDISSLNGTNGFRLLGSEVDYDGISVASAGDINGDGFADMIVGNDTHNAAGGRHVGISYVVFGGASIPASLGLATLNGSNGFRIIDATAYDYSGHTVASAGDVNGDGFDDLIIGASGYSPYSASGAAYVVFGKASGFSATIDLSALDGSNGFKITGPGTTHYVESAASAGDVNGDGLDDLIVGVPNTGSNSLGSGSSYVVFGHEADTAVNRNGTGASQNLVGGAFDDTLRGLGGNDKLYGHAGADELFGGAGADVLIGGAGRDTLTGGSGNDTFKLLDISDSGVGGASRDVIRDFTQGSDKIDLSAIDANSHTAGDDAFTFVGTAAFSHTAGEIRQFDNGNGRTVIAGDVDGDGHTDFQITLVGVHTLNAGDFIL